MSSVAPLSTVMAELPPKALAEPPRSVPAVTSVTPL